LGLTARGLSGRPSDKNVSRSSCAACPSVVRADRCLEVTHPSPRRWKRIRRPRLAVHNEGRRPREKNAHPAERKPLTPVLFQVGVPKKLPDCHGSSAGRPAGGNLLVGVRLLGRASNLRQFRPAQVLALESALAFDYPCTGCIRGLTHCRKRIKLGIWSAELGRAHRGETATPAPRSRQSEMKIWAASKPRIPR